MAAGASSTKSSEQRRSVVEKAREEWIRQLIDLSRRNNLLYYRPLKTGTLDLSLADGDRMAALLSGDTVPISKLVDDPSDEKLAGKLKEIWRRAQTNAEEKGLATLFAALGMATWTAADGGRDPDAPILLLPVALELKGRLAQALSIRRTGTVQLNLVLLHVLESEFGVKLTSDDLIPLLQGEDEGEVFDPSPVYGRLSEKCAHIPRFQVRNVAVLGNFAFQKMAMVNDLRERGENLVANDVIAALAGDSDARKQVGARNIDPDPREFDRTPPQDEFLILDADSSQQKAIAAVLKGQSAVVHGPPGTGKSQTIANLIASLTAQGRRILFVAEKRAALEVVKKRLKQVGLEHIAIDMHGADVSPKLVLEQVGKALEAVRTSTPVECEEMHRRFVERRDRLNRHVERLHRKCEPGGHTVYELQGRILRLLREVNSVTRWRGVELKRIAEASPQKVRDLLKEAHGFASLFLRTDPSPWTSAKLPDGLAVQKVVDLVGRLATRTVPEFDAALANLLETTEFKPPTTLEEARQMFVLLVSVQKILSLYSARLYGQNLQKLLSDLKPGCSSSLAALWAWCTNAAFREARKQVLALRIAGRAPVRDLHAELSSAEADRLRWVEWSGRKTLPLQIPTFQKHSQKLDTLLVEVKELESLGPKSDLEAIPLDELRRYVEALSKDSLTPHRMPKLWEIERSLENAGASELTAEIRSARVEPDKWEALFDHAWFSSCLDAALLEDPDIAGFNGRTHDSFVQEFKELDKERIRIAVARVRRAYGERAIAEMNAHPEQEYLVRAEAQKKRRHLPLRRLFAQAHEVLTAVCPCWMASPLSVSQLLDGRQGFDVVIFDEASQVLPQDAVPAILRATHLVVAGDSRQLPPTTFFAAVDDDELIEEEEASAAKGFESLLDTANAFVPSCYLSWHYRSRDESLISFSNYHIYRGRLITFPGPGGPPAVRHVLANQPLGVDGQEESSAAEVQKVVELALEHAEKRPNETLGVIAMGIRHADRVQRALDEALEQRPDLDRFFDPGAEERFFVKNLERVQGDERDAIILTVGYGKDRGGNLPFRFGPLLSQGGQRRLNVAVTRARQRITLVSSFGHLDMNPERVRPGTGVELLRFYLQYAATEGKRLADAAPTDFPLNEFEAEVCDVLQSKGIPLIPQMGASRFRIDLVAQHPREPGRFVLAIECDGASYHSSPTARDRDRLRQQQLENLGWRFHRIWSTDWFMRKEEEIERALVAYKAAVERADSHRPAGSTLSANQHGTATGSQPPNPASHRGPRPNVAVRDSITEYYEPEIMQLIKWINSDGRLRTDDEIIEELLPELGFTRRGARIEAVVRHLLDRMRSPSKYPN
jgi:very-short-patch-repair endonuclease